MGEFLVQNWISVIRNWIQVVEFFLQTRLKSIYEIPTRPTIVKSASGRTTDICVHSGRGPAWSLFTGFRSVRNPRETRPEQEGFMLHAFPLCVPVPGPRGRSRRGGVDTHPPPPSPAWRCRAPRPGRLWTAAPKKGSGQPIKKHLRT